MDTLLGYIDPATANDFRMTFLEYIEWRVSRLDRTRDDRLWKYLLYIGSVMHHLRDLSVGWAISDYLEWTCACEGDRDSLKKLRKSYYDACRLSHMKHEVLVMGMTQRLRVDVINKCRTLWS